MEKQTAIETAAREVIAHGGPECLTDPHRVLDALTAARAAGATTADIADEMRRQRDA